MPLPGMRGTDHIGFTVPDLDQAERFFVDIIGCQRVYALGPFEREDDWMEEQLNVHPRSVIKENRHFRCGHGTNFEIFEWTTPEPPASQPRHSDLGGHHLAFYVDDLDLAIDYLRSEGVEVLGDIVMSKQGAAGQRWIYFLTPWGMQCELVSYPNGKAYEAESEVVMWNPTRPAD